MRNGRVSSIRPEASDRDGWALANPGMGRWVPEEGLSDLYDELGDELFLRECMCVWEPESDGGDLVVPTWSDLADRESRIESHHQIALDVAPFRKWASFGAAGRRSDGRVHVEAWEHRPGTDWVLDVACKSWVTITVLR